MRYYSTRNKNSTASLEEAVKKGLAPDKGLFMPERFKPLSNGDMQQIQQSTSLAETARIVANQLFGEDIKAPVLREIVDDAVYFDTPLVQVAEHLFALELFHGPTLAFKDVGARFMARLLEYYTRGDENEVHVLVATSGDTGSAVANGFLDVKGINVHVLYPSGQVSPLQEKQFTTLGRNISALEIDGSFDDCQALVKSAFSDTELRSKMILTSANSINLARFLPQSFYYFRAWAQVQEKEPVFSVPSGNYGNLTAGLVARQLGLPVRTFIAASNANDVVPVYLQTGEYNPRPSIPTIANAMDVGSPSNFERILDLFGNDHAKIAGQIKGFSYSDDSIRKIIAELYKSKGYILDPHGATAYEAGKTYLREHPGETVIFLETAHPAKFPETVNRVIGKKVVVPERLQAFAEGTKKSIPLSTDYEDFRSYLLKAI